MRALLRGAVAEGQSAIAIARCMLGLAVALSVAGCASDAPTRFHTLLAPAAAAPSSTPTRAAPPNWALSVSLPAQIDRPQWVVERSDGSIAVLEHDRWLAPLADEVHAALADRLRDAPGGPGRIAVDVQRLDARLGRASRLQAAWSLRRPGGEEQRCQAQLVEPAPGGLAELARAHRAVFAALGERIVASIGGC